MRKIHARPIETYQAGPFRMNLMQEEHYAGERGPWSVQIWNGFNSEHTENLKSERAARLLFEAMKADLDVEVAKMAFGL